MAAFWIAFLLVLVGALALAVAGVARQRDVARDERDLLEATYRRRSAVRR